MKPGSRALGVAESYRGTDGATSTLAGAVVRADRTVDDFVFGTCTVGGGDATDTIVDCWRRLDRPDVQYVFVAGVALAWYNLVDLEAVAAATDRPVLSVSFEASEGLTNAIAEAFDSPERDRRIEAYEALPDRRRLVADGEELFVRSVGVDDGTADRVLRAFTHGRRPEPLRVAKRAARRADTFRRD
ncbi:DUF99 domain-containing protein [Halobacteriales archaeon QS_9_68_42]|nr:MAG: DUF99 domain-containing protein [Halobacteriales archaeon QS_9_68_42]